MRDRSLQELLFRFGLVGLLLFLVVVHQLLHVLSRVSVARSVVRVLLALLLGAMLP